MTAPQATGKTSGLNNRPVIDHTNEFFADMLHGLAQTQKTLPCKWFYDEAGSVLFEEITQTPEYYLTRVESRLLARLAPELMQWIPNLKIIIEPGSGASIKTRLLLTALPQLASYIPIDISEQFLLDSASALRREFPALQIKPVVDDFTQPKTPLDLAPTDDRLLFFPGSTIGNFAPDAARELLLSLRTLAGSGTWLLLGIDMTQRRDQLVAAYNDAAGITARFNKNILLRANRELGADFKPELFEHSAVYRPQKHRMEMHLVSTCEQEVSIQGYRFTLEQGETIHTENCYKYPRQELLALVRQAGWAYQQLWQDDTESEFGLFLLKSD